MYIDYIIHNVNILPMRVYHHVDILHNTCMSPCKYIITYVLRAYLHVTILHNTCIATCISSCKYMTQYISIFM